MVYEPALENLSFTADVVDVAIEYEPVAFVVADPSGASVAASTSVTVAPAA